MLQWVAQQGAELAALLGSQTDGWKEIPMDVLGGSVGGSVS